MLNRLHVARSFNLRMFEADSVDELTAEQYKVLVEILLEIQAMTPPDKTDKTVSIRTK